jgi:WD40 repeat protein
LLIDADSGDVSFRLEGSSDAFYSADGKWLATGGKDGVILWDPETGAKLRTLPTSETCFRLNGSRQGQRLVANSVHGTCWLWDLAVSDTPKEWKEHPRIGEALALSADGRVLASLRPGGEVRLSLTDSEELLHVLPNSRTVTTAAFSCDGRLLAVADGERTVRLWEVSSGNHLRTLHGHTGMVRDVCFLPDPSRIVTGSTDGTVRIWDVDSGQELASLPGVRDAVNRVAVSVDGGTIAAVDTALRIWKAPPADISR